MERGFLSSGDKKKKKEGVLATPNDVYPIIDGIAKRVTNIGGTINLPKSILRKAIRNVVNDKHEVVKPAKDGGSTSKVSFEAVGISYAKPASPMAFASVDSPKTGCSFASVLQPNDTSNKFATKLGRDQVIEKGPWMIRKSPIILSKWSPSVSLKRGEVTKVLIWVKMYNVPILAYSEDGLSLFGTQIGKPIMLDAFTSSMCVESWGRISFARALIEIDAVVGLKKEVTMAIPEEEGDGYIKEVVRVEYDWKPPHCVDCKSFGHDTSLCPKHVREEVFQNSARDTKTTIMEENDDGFTKVKSRKKNKGANFGGIRLNEPKSKVMWQQKKGVDAKSNSTSPSTSSNAVGNDKGVSNPDLNTSNPFDVLNVDGDDMGESGTQPKNRMEASKTSSSKSVYGDDHKDKNISSPTVLKKWDVINEYDTTDDEDVLTLYGGYVGGGNQLEDEDFDFDEGFPD
nr:hypothetical protein [Tanacetum cinerariifolium]